MICLFYISPFLHNFCIYLPKNQDGYLPGIRPICHFLLCDPRGSADQIFSSLLFSSEALLRLPQVLLPLRTEEHSPYPPSLRLLLIFLQLKMY